jgi:hypothetical protein
MDPAHIVMSDVQRRGRRVVVRLLRKAVRHRVKPRKAMRIERLLRSTYELPISAGTRYRRLPARQEMTAAGE